MANNHSEDGNDNEAENKNNGCLPYERQCEHHYGHYRHYTWYDEPVVDNLA